MRTLQRQAISLWKEQEGQDLLEYTLLLACLALATFGLLAGMKTNISSIWTSVNSSISTAGTSGS